MKVIIGLVGEKLAGKDTAANYLVAKYSAGHFRFTHILDEILKILDLPLSRRHEIDLGLGLRKIFGNHVLVNALYQRMQQAKSDMLVVNGIRMDEFDVIKSWPNAKIIYITAAPEIRFQRYKERHEKTDDGAMDFEKFMEQEKEVTEVNIPAIGEKADYKINNVFMFDKLYEQVDEIMKEIKVDDKIDKN